MNDAVSAYTRQGIELVNQGRMAEAALCFEEFVRLAPYDAYGYNNLANVFLFLGRYDDAIANYRRPLDLLPTEPGFYNHLSYAHSKQGRAKEAEEYARHALRLRPNFAEAQDHLGIALGMQKRYDDAEACYHEALRLQPGFAKAHSNLAQLHALQRRDDEAIAHAEKAIQLDPRLAEPYAARGAVYIHQNKLDEALTASRRALQLNPHLLEPSFHEATVYLKKRQLADAAAVCRDALRINPNYVEMEYILGMVALLEVRLEDALGFFEKVLQAIPDDAQAHFNRAQIWLMQGNFEQGWPEHEWRWRLPDFAVQPITKPMWDGSSLAGKMILLHAEQGLGDTLQYIRYAPLVKKSGGTVIVACQESLLRVLGRCPGVDQLVSQDNFTGRADEHAPLMSLPNIFKTTVATIPGGGAYVFPDPTLVDKWRSALPDRAGFKIGIAWQGSPAHADDRFRSMPLSAFSPLAAVQGIRWFSLQKGYGREQLASAPFEVDDLSGRLEDFADAAAALMHLDLVITADTALAHLAGALGRPVWVALQMVPDHRRFLQRADSPWYPTARLFRQRHRGQWRDVFEHMADELTEMLRPTK